MQRALFLSIEVHVCFLSPSFKCSTEGALDAFFKGVFSRDSILAFLGSACPKAVEPIAELVHRWNISEVTTESFEWEHFHKKLDGILWGEHSHNYILNSIQKANNE